MADAPVVTRRPLVPSARQVEAGEELVRARPVEGGPGAGGGAPETTPRRPGWRRRATGWLADLDPRRIQGPRLPLVVCSLVAMATRAEEQAIGVLLPQIRAEFSVNLEFIVALGSAVTIAGLAAAPALGYLADRIRRVAMVRVAALASAAGGILQGLAPGISLFVAGRAVSHASLAVAQPAMFPLLTDYFPSTSRARVFTTYYAAGQFGAVLAPPVAGLIADRAGWRTAVVALGAVAAAAALLAFLVREPIRGRIERLEMGLDEEAARREQEPVTFGEAYRAARSITTLRRIWYATPFLTIAGLFNLLIVPAFFAEVFQLSSAQLGGLIAAINLASLLGLLVAGPVGERLLRDRPARVMAAGGVVAVAQALLIGALSLAEQLPVAIAVTVPLSFLTTLLVPAFYTVVSLVVPPRIRGLGLQTSAPWQVLGLALSPVAMAAASSAGLRQGILVFVPLLVIGGVIFASAAGGVERDMRAAKAAAVADEESRRLRESGRAKLLVCRDVDVAYDGVQVVFDVDLDVDEGEIVALLGTNGAGKSTLLRTILGTQEASGGAVFFDGRDVTHAPPHENAARGVVLMPGGAAVFPGLTVADNLRAAGAGDPAPVLDRFPRLRERLHTRAGDLSGGEQQLLGLAQALLMQPRLLVVDELSLGLSGAAVEEVTGLVREVAANGTAVLLVEQSVEVALRVADRVVFLESGRVQYDGPAEGLPDGLVRAVFLERAPAAVEVRRRPSRHEPNEDAPALAANGLWVRYGGVDALRDVTLAVQPQEIVGVTGPNGAGKTTLFDAVSGFVRPDRGSIELGGEDVTALPPHERARRGLARSFQHARLFPSLTVRETVATALERKAVANPLLAAVNAPSVRRSELVIGRRADDLVDLLGLGPWADSFVGELSTGTRRAVDLACVLAGEPTVLLLDEPSAGLAQGEVDELGPMLRQLPRQVGCALVLVEHNAGLVEAVASRVVEMELGAVVGAGERS